MPDEEALDVCWVNHFASPPDQSGGTRHLDLARELQRRGHRVTIVACDLGLRSGRYSRRGSGLELRPIHEEIEGVVFTWLSSGVRAVSSWRRPVGMAVFGLLAFLHLLRVPVRRGSTVFVGSTPHLLAALGTWAAARLRRVPFVLEVRDLWPESYIEVSGRRRGPEITLMRWVARLLYRQARAVIVLAPANVAHVCEQGADPARVECIPNGVDLETFDAGEPLADLSRDGCFTFVYAGAHGPANDLETVVRACELLQRRGHAGLHVVLLGGGPQKASLAALAGELELGNLTFVDPVPKSAIGPTLRTADAGLMVLAPLELFTYGVSPNKLFDYLAAGLPVLTNVPGLVSEIVAEAGAGIGVAPGSPEALADGMVELAFAPPEGAGERGRAYVAQHHDRRLLAIRVEELLSSVAAPP